MKQQDSSSSGTDQFGKKLALERCIQCICGYDSGSQQCLILGTCSMISSDGLFVTAKHVLIEDQRWRDTFGRPQPLVWDDESGYGPLVIEVSEKGTYFARPIIAVTCHESADIAIGNLRPLVHEQTKEIRRSPRVRIGSGAPLPVNSPIRSLGFPLGKLETHEGFVGLHLQPLDARGRITAYHPDGLGSFLPGASYEAHLLIESGSSGGPVFGGDGHVIGVHSTGIPPSEEFPIPFGRITCISEIMHLRIENGPTMRELYNTNVIG